MKVRDLIKKLLDYNPDADVDVIVNNYPAEWELWHGGSAGCTRETCDSVSFAVVDTCDAEAAA